MTKCLQCNGMRIASLFVQASNKIAQEENDIGYCYDCKKVVELDDKLRDSKL